MQRLLVRGTAARGAALPTWGADAAPLTIDNRHHFLADSGAIGAQMAAGLTNDKAMSRHTPTYIFRTDSGACTRTIAPGSVQC